MEFLYPSVTLEQFRADLEMLRLAPSVAEEWVGGMRFADVDALVTYIGFVPWDVPDFDADRHAAKLSELDQLEEITVSI